MADEETQGPRDTSWGAADGFPDSPLPAASFDEPLVWPEALGWDQPPAAGAAPPFDPPDVDGGEVPVPVRHTERQPVLDEPPVAHGETLTGLGGGTEGRPSARTVTPPPPPDRLDDLPTLGVAGLGGWPGGDGLGGDDLLPGSIWADGAQRVVPGNMLVTSSMSASAISAEADRNPGGRQWPRLNVRPGNAVMIALITVASLVLLGMFLSVRARNEVPTDASQTRPPGNDIAITSPLNTIPLTTTVTTAAPPPAINLSDLLPTPDTAGTAGTAGIAGAADTIGASGTTGAPGGDRSTGVDGGIGAGATGTTPATRSTTPSPGTSTATTQPAPQPTVTTVAPEPEPTAPATTAPPVNDPQPTVTTRPATPRPDFTIPDISVPSIPSMPQRTIPRFSGRDN